MLSSKKLSKKYIERGFSEKAALRMAKKEAFQIKKEELRIARKKDAQELSEDEQEEEDRDILEKYAAKQKEKQSLQGEVDSNISSTVPHPSPVPEVATHISLDDFLREGPLTAPAVATSTTSSSLIPPKTDEQILRENVKRATAAAFAARDLFPFHRDEALRKEKMARKGEAKYRTTLQQTGSIKAARAAAMTAGGIPVETIRTWMPPEKIPEASTTAPLPFLLESILKHSAMGTGPPGAWERATDAQRNEVMRKYKTEIEEARHKGTHSENAPQKLPPTDESIRTRDDYYKYLQNPPPYQQRTPYSYAEFKAIRNQPNYKHLLNPATDEEIRNENKLYEEYRQLATGPALVGGVPKSSVISPYKRAVETEAKYKATFQDNLERAAKEKGVSFEAILRDNTAMEGALAAARAAALAEGGVPVGLNRMWGATPAPTARATAVAEPSPYDIYKSFKDQQREQQEGGKPFEVPHHNQSIEQQLQHFMHNANNQHSSSNMQDAMLPLIYRQLSEQESMRQPRYVPVRRKKSIHEKVLANFAPGKFDPEEYPEE